MRSAAVIAVASLALLVVPAAAEWRTTVTDRDNIRSVLILGMDESDDQRQVGIVCTTLDGDKVTRPNLAVAIPSPQQFSVRPGDLATLTAQIGGTEWTAEGTVQSNDSSAFGVSFPDAGEAFFDAIDAAPADLSLTVASGAISETVNIGKGGLDSALQQYRDACGA